MTDTSALILIRRLRIQNANAISGPLSWGFPSPSAFMGFAHALQRRLRDSVPVRFGGVGVVCHEFEPQVSHGSLWRPRTFNLTRNPVGKDGSATSMVEEGRAHIELSLVLELCGEMLEDEIEALKELLPVTIQNMRIAGGSVLPPDHASSLIEWHEWYDTEDSNQDAFRKLRRRLLPGFALVQRDDLLAAHLDEMRHDAPESTVLDALLDLSRVNIRPEMRGTDDVAETQWHIERKPGWLVPVPVGYAGISALYDGGIVANARDDVTPVRFVETLYSLGEWLGPHRLTQLDQLLWRTESDPENGIYLCRNQFGELAEPTPASTT